MTDSNELDGRVAIVTGAGQGMGLAVACRLAASGARVVVNDNRDDVALRAAEKIKNAGGEAFPITGDVTSSSDVREIAGGTVRQYGAIHILVNNAGVLRTTPIIEIEEDEWDLVVNVTLKGAYLCTKMVLPSMQQAGWGRIVNFSSTAGKTVSTLGGPHYTAAKSGLLGLTRAVAKEVAQYGITVNAVCPGLIDTEMVRSTITRERIMAYENGFPISRIGKPTEVAELVAFLASDRASYITGSALDINGGDLMV